MSSPKVSDASEARIRAYACDERRLLERYRDHNTRALSGIEQQTARTHDEKASAHREDLQLKECVDPLGIDNPTLHRMLEQLIAVHEAKRDHALHLAMIAENTERQLAAAQAMRKDLQPFAKAQAQARCDIAPPNAQGLA